MALYRKLPVEIEAYSVRMLIDLFKKHFSELPDWVKEAYENLTINTITDDYFYVLTLEGTMIATKDDMLIKGVNGEIYPCKIEIFEKTYERIDQEVEVHTKPLEAELPEVRKRIGPTIIDKIITSA